jgi:peroxiredoxin Q/BCP
VDSLEVNKRFAQSLGVGYPILSDPDKKVAKAYGVVHGIRLWPERWTFYIGKDGKILYVDQKIKAQTAGEDVVKRLRELKLD